MDIWVEITRSLVEMMNKGGWYALVGLGMWLLFNLIRIGIIGGIIWACIRMVVNQVASYLALKFISRKDNLSILSDKCSNHIIKVLEEYQDKTSAIVKELNTQLDTLLKNCEKKT